MAKTILLTGATGFLGSHLAEALVEEGHHVVILKRSFSDIWRINHIIERIKSYDADVIPLEKIFQEQKIDVVIHTATNYGRKKERLTDIVETNVLFGLQLLESAIFSNTELFINTDSLQQKCVSQYSLSKRQFYDWLRIYSQSDTIKIINMRLDHMYGPRDDSNKFVVWLMQQMVADVPEIKLTAGEQKRDFIFIDDVVRAFLFVMQVSQSLPKFSSFDVGTGEHICVKEFVLMMKSVIETIRGKRVTPNLQFGVIPYRKGEVMEVVEDVSTLFNLGWKPQTELLDGLKITVREFVGGDTSSK
ncbi:MAG: NAD-dependent epimerase/dehydratase family protein [Crenarchaeota archaeon]|nr:NAD-dependent epimerase/dehydratase family protein [Thermoproteota archaeon]